MLSKKFDVPALIGLGFSHGEARVVEKLLEGMSNKQIGQALFIQEKSVKFHNTNIFKKAKVTSRSELISKYLSPEVPITEKFVRELTTHEEFIKSAQST